MRLYCPTCGKRISPDDVDIDGTLATCRACGSVTSVRIPHLQILPTPVRPSGTRQHGREIQRPTDISVEDDGTRLVITFSCTWRRRLTETAVACVAWNSCVVVCYGLALTNSDPYVMWPALVILTAHLLCGLMFVHLTLARHLNHTAIEVTSEFLDVRHGPVPGWAKNQTLAVDELERFYCYNKVRSSNCVGALTKEGSIADLVRQLPSYAQAFFIKQELESWLKTRREKGRRLRSSCKEA
jgi:hypothetical protein